MSMFRESFWRALSGVGLGCLCACSSISTDTLFSGVGAGGTINSNAGRAEGGSDSVLGVAGRTSAGGSTSLAGGSAGGASAGGADAAGASAGGSLSSNGGASAAGGSPTGGASGSAGSLGAGGAGGAPPSACDGKRAKAKAFIDDFEQGVTNNWFGYVDNSPAAVVGTAPGALGTHLGARFLGDKAEKSGMGHGMSCTDVSAFDGISFWAKSATGGPVRFLAAIPATDPSAGVGDCKPATMVCYDHPGKLFNFTGDWAHYSAAWSELAQYGWGTKATFNHVINTVLWINDGPVVTSDFSIDEVVLYKGEPPAGKAND